MLEDRPAIEFTSADNSEKRLRIESTHGQIVAGKLMLEKPSPQFFKRITASDGKASIELLLDLASLEKLCRHLTIVVELAKGKYGG